ncbi:MAG: hypothetical protein JHC54_10510 [Acinetobacter sp.]|nr:hypothetical protein [Acinetobacter sp.]
MSENLRDQFKARPVTVFKDAEDSAKTYSNDRPGHHSIDDGFNHFRIAPALPGAKTWLYPFCRIYLQVESEQKDDKGNVVGVEVKNRPIFHAGVHGPRNEEGKHLYKDIVDAYRQIVNEQGKQAFAKEDDRKKYLRHITGYRDSTGKWISGLLPNTGYMAYAWKLKDGKWPLGRIEFNNTCYKDMKALAAQ